MDVEAHTPLIHQLMNSLYEEFLGLLLSQLYCHNLDIFI